MGARSGRCKWEQARDTTPSACDSCTHSSLCPAAGLRHDQIRFRRRPNSLAHTQPPRSSPLLPAARQCCNRRRQSVESDWKGTYDWYVTDTGSSGKWYAVSESVSFRSPSEVGSPGLAPGKMVLLLGDRGLREPTHIGRVDVGSKLEAGRTQLTK